VRKIKEISMLVIFVVCTYAGFYWSAVLKKRLKLLECIEKAVVLLRGEINYKSLALEEALENVSKIGENAVCNFFLAISCEMNKYDGRSMCEIASSQQNILKKSILSGKDVENLIGLVGNLGLIDKEMQISVIDMFLEQLEIRKIECREEINKNFKMYRCLGAFVGAMICILIA